MRVLLIEDEPAIARACALMLTTEAFAVHATDLRAEGLDLVTLYDYDIIPLDLNLPDVHSYDVLTKLRMAKVHTPVLILSATADVDAKVHGFECGADDYVTKPFQRDELIARMHALVRRSKGHAQPLVQTGRLIVNLDARTAEANGARIPLTAREFGILELLALRKDATLTKEMLLSHRYCGIDEPNARIIDVFQSQLRGKLARACGGAHYIETIWGRGYVLRDPDETALAA